MHFIWPFLFFIFLTSQTCAQVSLNLGFESRELMPWFKVGKSDGFTISFDEAIFTEGKQSIKINDNSAHGGFHGLLLWIPQNIKGDSIEISARIKFKDINKRSKLGLMLRIDPALFFENLESETITSSADWKTYTLKSKLYPDLTTGIAIGVWLLGKGTLWADDFRIKVDGKHLSQDNFISFKSVVEK